MFEHNFILVISFFAQVAKFFELFILYFRHGHGVNANKDSTKIMFKHFSNFFSSDEATVSTVHSVAKLILSFTANVL